MLEPHDSRCVTYAQSELICTGTRVRNIDRMCTETRVVHTVVSINNPRAVLIALYANK